MKANPDKFQFIAVGKKTHEMNPILDIGHAKLESVSCVKLLGTDIDYLLKFDNHITLICRKASQQLNALKRLGPYLSRLNKLTILHTFILSNFNFCPLSWHFCSMKNTRKIEKVQERALRFVYDDFKSSYDDLLAKAKLPSLYTNRCRTLAIETFKIVNGLAPQCLLDLVKVKSNKYSFRYQNVLEIPQVRTMSYGQKSFRYAAASLWNKLPNHFRTEHSFSHFKSLIRSWNGLDCKCSMCK